jgi:hypothetical protein
LNAAATESPPSRRTPRGGRAIARFNTGLCGEEAGFLVAYEGPNRAERRGLARKTKTPMTPSFNLPYRKRKR